MVTNHLLTGMILHVVALYMICWNLPPNQDASDHQDSSIFCRESQPKPSFKWLLLGGGVDLNDMLGWSPNKSGNCLWFYRDHTLKMW